MAKTGIIFAINGPIVKTSNDSGFEMHEMVYVGEENLVGEVIGLTTDATIIEVYALTAIANLLVKFDNGTNRGFIFGASRLLLAIATMGVMNLIPILFLV